MTNAEGKDKDKSETKSDYLSAQQDEAKEPTVHVGEHQQLVTSVATVGHLQKSCTGNPRNVKCHFFADPKQCVQYSNQQFAMNGSCQVPK